MKLDNETLTAYVLGELEESERRAVEEMLRGNEAAREAVAELEATAGLAREILHGGEPVSLASAQVAAIEAKAAQSPRPKARLSKNRWTKLAAAAAVVLIVAGATAALLPGIAERARRQHMAMTDTSVEPAETPVEDYAPRESTQPPVAFGRRLPEQTWDTSADAINNRASAQAAPEPAFVQQRARLNVKADFDDYFADPRTRLNVKAEFTDDAKAFVEIDNSNAWGEDFRSAYAGNEGEAFRQIPPGTHPPEFQDPNKVYWPDHNTEAYKRIVENPFMEVANEPLSTFSIDVDTASYANMRRFLTQGQVPPPDSVRIEELVNYFDYDYAPPADKSTPFAAHVEVAACPWAPEHRLARIGLKGWEMAAGERPASNLVFLIDVSGSMQPENKLPLLKEALRMLVRQLDERDRIAIVVYAGNSGLVLPSTPGNELEIILGAIDGLESGGSTHGSAGIELAYETAVQNFLPGGTNRVLLCTDGDFNVGTTDEGQLTRLIEEKAKSKVFLTVLGFGMGNLKDATLEMLADKGNGNYGYIDTLNEARKVLVQGLSGTLVTIAKDVKIQVEFNPAQVKAYRLVGYENRVLAAQDFNDDTKDAGEIGAGHTVTALYELVPPGAPTPGAPSVDPLKYQQPVQPGPAAQSGELLTLKLRYKQPEGDTSSLLEFPVRDEAKTLAQATPDFRFASAVASFGMILRGSEHKGSSTFESVLDLAQGGLGKDPDGYRGEFVQLVQRAKTLPQIAQ